MDIVAALHSARRAWIDHNTLLAASEGEQYLLIHPEDYADLVKVIRPGESFYSIQPETVAGVRVWQHRIMGALIWQTTAVQPGSPQFAHQSQMETLLGDEWRAEPITKQQ